MGTTPIYGFPYPDPSDLVANYPALGQQLAEDIEAELLAAGKILQIISTNKVDVFSTSSQSLTDVTGLSVTITPSDNTNKIFIMVTLALNNNTSTGTSRAALLRGSTQIGGGTGVGSRGSANARARVDSNANGFSPIAFNFLDSPATTSATTYKIQVGAEAGTSVYVNYGSGGDSDNQNHPRLASSITVFEVSA